MRLCLCLSLLGLLVSAQTMPVPGFSNPSVPVAVIVSNITATLNLPLGAGSTSNFKAQAFVVPAGASSRVTKITLRLARIGNPFDNVVVQLYTSIGTFPNAHPFTPMDTSTTTLVGASMSTSLTAYDFAFPNTPVIAGGGYWIVVSRSINTSDPSNCYSYAYSNASSFPGGTFVGSSNGTSWTSESTTIDIFFMVWGTTP